MKRKFWIAALVCLLLALGWVGWKYYEWREATRDPVKLAKQLVADIERQTGKSPFAPQIVEMPAAPVKTSNVYPLPPDPGPEGMKTLLGVDANHNGVRDDSERFIVKKYGDSERVREALFDYARVNQEWINVSTKIGAIKIDSKLDDVMACIRFSMGDGRNPNGISKWYQAMSEVEALKLNTPERARASQKTDEFLAGHGSDSHEADGSTCSFDPQSLKN